MTRFRLINPTYDARRRRAGNAEFGGEGGTMAHHKHHHGAHRRKNPFTAGNVNQLAVKVAGALGGAIAAATVPSAIAPTLNTGWGGVGIALVIAFGGAWLLKNMSQNLAEGVLIGGSVQAVSRAITIVTGKTLLTAGLGQYGPLNFTIPVPAYQPGGAGSPAIAASASKTSSGSKVATMPGAAMSGRSRMYSKWAA